MLNTEEPWALSIFSPLSFYKENSSTRNKEEKLIESSEA